MVVIDERPLKKMKRRPTSEMQDFLKFPATEDEFSGAFRSNINGFLRKHGQPPPTCELFQHVLVWQILFRIGELIDGPDSSSKQDFVTLYVVEEDVARSKSVYCDQCRVIGWSAHPVCRKRYHFIIRRDSTSIDGHQKQCANCGDRLHFSDPSCRSCSYMDPEYDIERWVHMQLEDTSHLLHGVVHSNGYGHLLRVNGKEGGSKVLTGCDIMGFWDRLCKSLGVRKISVMDVSKKYGLDYRLLHGVTNGHTWYGKWDYEFATGSFALNQDAYQKAVKTLSGIPLSLFYQSRTPRTRLHDVIIFYQSLSECELTTMRDLFSSLVELIHNNVHELSEVKPKENSWLCPWSKDDIECVEQSMIKVLRAVGGSHWVSLRALKGSVRGVASVELVDHCLKELGGKSVDGMVVFTRCNAESESVEYRLVCSGTIANDTSICTVMNSNRPTMEHVLRDLKFLYDSLLNPETMWDYKPTTTRDNAVSSAACLLDCKQFVKVYRPENAVKNPFALQLACEVELLYLPKDYTVPPPELIILPLNATIADFMVEATKAFQDMYILFETFQIEELLGYEYVYCSSQLKYLVGSVATVRVHGRLDEVEGLEEFRMERGTDWWIVNCTCGAKDDDGERMLACDHCSIWLHTRCAGIDDLKPVPERFVCWRCCGSPKKAAKQFGGKCSKASFKASDGLYETCGKTIPKKGLAKIPPKHSETIGKGVGKKGLPKMSTKLSKFSGKTCKNIVDGVNLNKVRLVSQPSFAVRFKNENAVTLTPNHMDFPNCSEDTPASQSVKASKEESVITFSCNESLDKQLVCEGDEAYEKGTPGFLQTCSSKIGSAGSGTGSECIDETMAVVDTCSSDKTFCRHSESGWNCKNEPSDVLDTCRIGSSLTVPFSVR